MSRLMTTEKFPEETELVNLAGKGDLNAFRVLIDRYQGLVAGTVIGMLGFGATAQDIGQETFIRLYKNLDKFRGESGVGTYVTRIAINLCLNEIRRQKRRHLWGLLNLSIDEASIDGQAEMDSLDIQTKVRKRILELEINLRSIVVLHWLEGHSIQETADILEIPLGTALSRLHRSHGILKIWLKPLQEKRYE